MEYNTTLQHHGTKGMKWGKRLYQNKDGSLTALGRVRYAGQQKRLNKQRAANLEKARQVKRTKEEEAKILAEKKEKLLKSTNAAELYKNRDMLTTAEINERLQRMDTERRLAAVAESTKKSGFDYVDKALKVGKKLNEVYEFTNTPVMKAFKKQLGIEKAEKRLGLDDIYKMRDKMSNAQLSDALKRANTEKAIKKILDDDAAAAAKRADAQKRVKDYYDDLYNPKTESYSAKGDDIIDRTYTTGKRSNDSDTTSTSKSTPLLEEKIEKVTGTVEGKGTSRSNIKNDGNNTKKEKPADYYDPIDASFVDDKPISEIKTTEVATAGKSYIETLFLLEDKRR